ncbi:MAG: DUF1002 domain-containing protein, partial [Clostridia bacterium]|nr:DUF1002 domain-containing protein [Clostridia bacterium]
MNGSMLKRWAAVLLSLVLAMAAVPAQRVRADQTNPSGLVLTLAADITKKEKAKILKYFGISEKDAKVITVTNADEHAQLDGLLPDKVIGKKTRSCALIRPTTSGGVQVKTANMNYVTSNMIASTLLTSGVNHCEVLAAAPNEVSDTGALTGVMMAYEAATGTELDPEKKKLANEELVVTGEIGESIGQDRATLAVNDVKLHISRDGITEVSEVDRVVDEVISTTDEAAMQAAAVAGKPAPVLLGDVENSKLYTFGRKFSQMDYNYAEMQPTLERVTRNVAKATGIQDPIMDTFTTTDDSDSLFFESILLNTEDAVMGADAKINATNASAVGDHPAEVIPVYTGDVRLTEAGKIKAGSFISGSNLIAYRDVNGKYALMDLNGNILTESVYTDGFKCENGRIIAVTDDQDRKSGLLNTDGTVLIPNRYDDVVVPGNMWGVGITMRPGTDEDYDYWTYDGKKYQIDTADVYYLGGGTAVPAGTLSREAYIEAAGVGDVLIVRDRKGSCTTFDSGFAAVEHPADFSESTYDDSRRLGEKLSSQMKIGVGKFYGNYAIGYDNDKCGVVDRYGNQILPFAFDSVNVSEGSSLISGGYMCAEQNGQLVYAVQGGDVTARYPVNEDDLVWNYGMASRVRKGTGGDTSVIVAGDGAVFEVNDPNSSLSALSASKGLMWKAERVDGYDLLDWHGNTLLTGSDNYSLSANGNYLIARDGYTSSTLYLVNDASPVTIAETAGGAVELTGEVREGASLIPYTGSPSLVKIGPSAGSDFITGTELMTAEDESTGLYAVIDLAGRQLTEAEFDRYSFEFDRGWIKVTERRGDEAFLGLMSRNGAMAVPCEYDHLEVLNENWAIAYQLTQDGTANDRDFFSGDKNYRIGTAVICHLTAEEVSKVSLSRDQFAEAQAEEDYINIRNRATGAVTTYNGSFEAVATVDYPWDFSGFSTREVLLDTIRDKTGYSVYDQNFPDGYSRAYDGSNRYGVIDMRGEPVIPFDYDRIEDVYNPQQHVWANGYFCVEKDGKFGYVTAGGVETCPLAFSAEPYFGNAGMAARVHNEDDSYTLVAADGVISEGYSYLSDLGAGLGLLWTAEQAGERATNLIDWHGNVLMEDVYSVHASGSGKYVLIQTNWQEPYVLYGVKWSPSDEIAIPQSGDAAGEAAEAMADDEEEAAEAVEGAEETAEEAAEAAAEAVEAAEEAVGETAEAVEETAEEAAEEAAEAVEGAEEAVGEAAEAVEETAEEAAEGAEEAVEETAEEAAEEAAEAVEETAEEAAEEAA